MLMVGAAVACLPGDPKTDDDLQEVRHPTSQCTEVCNAVTSCSAEPPDPTSGAASTDCAASCVQPDAAFYGYADCQLPCLLTEDCSTLEDCWDATSDVFAQYCESDAPAVASTAPSNGTATGSAEADVLVNNPAVREAVGDADFVVHMGDSPPDLSGLYAIYGEVYESFNARPPGTPVATELCLSSATTDGASLTIQACELSVPGLQTLAYTGSGQDFTVYLDHHGVGIHLLNGTLDDDGTTVSGGEMLLVYTHSLDVWEKGIATWSYEAACGPDDCTP